MSTSEARLEDPLRGVMRRWRMSPYTEEIDVQWYRCYVLHLGQQHPRKRWPCSTFLMLMARRCMRVGPGFIIVVIEPDPG